MSLSEVFEMQGPYGAYHLSESVLQSLWNNGDFSRDELQTESGKKICVIHTGRWNSFEGPDFLEAIIEMDGRRLVGSVEIHFKADDWYAHRHESNPLYRDVILHVVLFKPKSNASYVYFSDQAIETLTLMPHLKVDLESYALNLALLSFEGFNPSIKNNFLSNESSSKMVASLLSEANQRFDEKVHYAKKRLLKFNWEEACHQYVLEVLGYSRNRIGMARLALRHGFKQWPQSSHELYKLNLNAWRLKSNRPANHPSKRLRQYDQLMLENPEWPKSVIASIQAFDAKNFQIRIHNYRRSKSMHELKRRFHDSVFKNFVGVSRLNTILIDAIFPLLHAKGVFDCHSLWLDWWVGDQPNQWNSLINRALDEAYRNPIRNAWLQGINGLYLKSNLR